MSLREEISRRVTQIQDAWLGHPDHLIFFGYGIGDDLLCTTVAHELKRRGAGKIVMFTKHPDLFEASPDIAAAYNFGYSTVGRRRRWGYSGILPRFSTYDKLHDRDVFLNEPILKTMCRMSGITGSIDLRPYITLHPNEKSAGRFFENQAVIQSSGLAFGSGVMKNKNWFPERFQAAADQLDGELKIIQLGQKTDPPLQGVLDLRGKTTLRESAAILSSSRVFVGQVGFLMHLSRAVDCRGIIVYGGREDPKISGYTAFENLVGLPHCAFCWQRNKCDFDHECMRMIQPDHVVAAVRRQLDRNGVPLETERANLEIPEELVI